jgi:hypothetical protein
MRDRSVFLRCSKERHFERRRSQMRVDSKKTSCTRNEPMDRSLSLNWLNMVSLSKTERSAFIDRMLRPKTSPRLVPKPVPSKFTAPIKAPKCTHAESIALLKCGHEHSTALNGTGTLGTRR